MLKFYAIPKHEVNEARVTSAILRLKRNPENVLEYLMSHPCDDIAVYLDKIATISIFKYNFNQYIYDTLIAITTIRHFESGFDLNHKLDKYLV